MIKWKYIGVLLGGSIWNDRTAKYSLKKIKKNHCGSGIFPFLRQYLSTDSFHLHFCPFSRGKKSSQTVNHSLIWSAGWVFYQHSSDARSKPHTRTHACSLFLCRESEAGSALSAQCLQDFVQEEKREAAFVVIEALTGWCHLITVQMGGGGERGRGSPLGWR